MKQSFYWLDTLLPSQSFLVGRKAFALSKLIKSGYPILNGFAIDPAAMKQFLEIIGNSAPLLADFPHSSLHLDVKNHQELQSVAQKSRQLINAASLDRDFVSALLDEAERLNVPTLILRASLQLPEGISEQKITGLLPGTICSCNRSDLEKGLKQAWSQLFSAKSLFFWNQLGIGIERLNLAILVQPIHNAIASGTVEINRNAIQIQSSWGLGHSLLKGEILPDFYQFRRGAQILDNKHLGTKMRAYCLQGGNLSPYLLTESEQERYSLNEVDLKNAIEIVENLASDLQDTGFFEWTITDTPEPKFYIIQFLRTPIITSPSRAPSMKKDRVLLKGLAASPGVAIATVSIVSEVSESLPYFAPNTILVIANISPSWFPILKQAAGIIAEVGGVTSHAAIIARELGIPAIVGATNATKLLPDGQLILLDGNSGEISPLIEGEQNNLSLDTDRHLANVDAEVINRPIATKLWVNLSQLSSLPNAVNLPVDGLGLLRSEIMLLDLISSEPLHSWLQPDKQVILSERLTESLAQFAAAFAPRPVFYRSLDWHFFESNRNQPKFNSERGTYNYLIEPILFELELKAIAAVQRLGYNNLNLILPFVRSVEEFIFCRDRVAKIGLDRVESFQLWIMAEVPSVFFLLSQYVEAGVKGIAIGTNDLTELLLGTNRDRSELRNKFNSRHPAMLKALKELIRSAKKMGITCSICGQAPVEYPQSIEQLIRWGIDSISVEPQAVKTTYRAIARAEQSLILSAARSQLCQD
ncbi:MAG: PEP/pyruvate-binding domain-containing protein [Prochloraceae cyanobacterium]|nr:PEP/pyruvate-binding domain-containing protein [Prochloraceae cyanobacterium]